MTDEYIPVKKSQVTFLNAIPLYYFSKDKEPLLYKESGVALEQARFQLDKFPELFLHKSDKNEAYSELQKNLNLNLARSISSKGFAEIKALLGNIVEEALKDPSGSSLEMLPETIEILFKGYSENKTMFDSLILINNASPFLIDHTVNILSLTMHYCFFHGFSESDTKKMGICAILHDIGLTEVEQTIFETEDELTDSQFEQMKTHCLKGYRLVRDRSNFEKEIAMVALEHHEKLDGSGYPYGKKTISDEANLIGLIDCYEYLAYREKNFRRAQKPFGSLQILKKDVMAG
ncbi:MAG: HD domain-containing protein, partial [Desulfamplus sp.]|nr:HD domain-containing protein [Desulfamplus sp.]